MMYGSWDMERDRQNFLSYWAIFWYFTPLTAQNPKFWKKEKKAWRYNRFTQVYQKSWSHAMVFLGYGAWRMWLSFFILGYILPFYPPRSSKSQNLKKKWQTCVEISSFYTCVPKTMIRWYTVPEIRRATDGQTDKRSDIWRWVSHLKMTSN